MNEFNQNSRTLIVSFVVAIMALVPLRFVEAGQMVVDSTPVVLGEKTESAPVLEAPYSDIESGTYRTCLTVEDANSRVNQLESRIGSGELENDQIAQVLSDIEQVRQQVCE